MAADPEQKRKYLRAYFGTPEGKARRRAYTLMYEYGLTTSEFVARFDAQGRRCALCGTTEPEGKIGRKGWCVDHEHATGRFRGVLCPGCNIALGGLGDTFAEIETSAIKMSRYLGRSAFKLISARPPKQVTWNRRPKGPRRNQRERALWRDYGLTPATWSALFNEQGRRCGICDGDDPRCLKGWHTDHERTSQSVRGILCQPCNLSLGRFGDAWGSIQRRLEVVLKYAA